ncbi:hypothetical protein HaLaN_17417 [Haematococcus lacustris]|uniref:Uncharacterized protein n=1 Tax=Haematococcus lacustris TaxID=44745 RepID=A0A699ZN09_HAELA|nr:hypothetical protein HaLaN_17417 [Haematococcus lacustris]
MGTVGYTRPLPLPPVLLLSGRKPGYGLSNVGGCSFCMVSCTHGHVAGQGGSEQGMHIRPTLQQRVACVLTAHFCLWPCLHTTAVRAAGHDPTTYNEQAQYRYSAPGYSSNTGHFTQMPTTNNVAYSVTSSASPDHMCQGACRDVWRDTKQLGCATAKSKCTSQTIYVCRQAGRRCSRPPNAWPARPSAWHQPVTALTAWPGSCTEDISSQFVASVVGWYWLRRSSWPWHAGLSVHSDLCKAHQQCRARPVFPSRQLAGGYQLPDQCSSSCVLKWLQACCRLACIVHGCVDMSPTVCQAQLDGIGEKLVLWTQRW